MRGCVHTGCKYCTILCQRFGVRDVLGYLLHSSPSQGAIVALYSFPLPSLGTGLCVLQQEMKTSSAPFHLKDRMVAPRGKALKFRGFPYNL